MQLCPERHDPAVHRGRHKPVFRGVPAHSVDVAVSVLSLQRALFRSAQSLSSLHALEQAPHKQAPAWPHSLSSTQATSQLELLPVLGPFLSCPQAAATSSPTVSEKNALDALTDLERPIIDPRRAK
jgi:hypothetical protein